MTTKSYQMPWKRLAQRLRSKVSMIYSIELDYRKAEWARRPCTIIIWLCKITLRKMSSTMSLEEEVLGWSHLSNSQITRDRLNSRIAKQSSSFVRRPSHQRFQRDLLKGYLSRQIVKLCKKIWRIWFQISSVKEERNRLANQGKDWRTVPLKTSITKWRTGLITTPYLSQYIRMIGVCLDQACQIIEKDIMQRLMTPLNTTSWASLVRKIEMLSARSKRLCLKRNISMTKTPTGTVLSKAVRDPYHQMIDRALVEAATRSWVLTNRAKEMFTRGSQFISQPVRVGITKELPWQWPITYKKRADSPWPHRPTVIFTKKKRRRSPSENWDNSIIRWWSRASKEKQK